jgi:transposase
LSTRTHLLADSLGRPVRLALAPGQSSDLAPASQMIAGQSAGYALADRACDAEAFQAIRDLGAEPVIPPT